MANVTNDLLYEVLKAVQRDTTVLRNDVTDLKSQMTSVRGHLIAIEHDVANIYARLGDHDDRLERIETRLGLLEPAH